MSIISAMQRKRFQADFEKFQEMCETGIIKNLVDHKKRFGFLPSSLWKVLLKFFLRANPIPISKKNLIRISSLRF